MSKYEIAIAIKNFANNPEAKVPRMKEGEIIAVQPYPWSWGRKELCGFFIVIIESSRTLAEMRQFTQGFYKRLDTDELISDGMGNYLEHEQNIQCELADKNRYRIPFAKIAANCQGLNIGKVQDENKFYQPFKNKSDCLEKFSDTKNMRYYISPAVMDTTTDLSGEEEEIIIDLDSAPFLIWDKLEGKWVK
ncbi:hypothetical protein KAR91_43135 [Candidatus Pacearchaeota archaeon]|nr:hypothetical protein [Candidatus Pacearchaeota archaeon]